MNPVRKALYNYLKNDTALVAAATGGIHHKVAPRGTKAPYLIYGRMSEVPMRTFDGPSLDKDVWMVKAVGEAEQAEDLDRIVQQLLDRATLFIPGKVSLDVYRLQVIDFSELVEGELIHHVGHEYKVDSEEG